MSPESALTIAAMALLTYATRAGGLWLMARVAPTPRIAAWMRQIPGAVLVALVAPAALGQGPAEALAVAGTAVVATRSGNVLLAMVAGIGLVVVLRLMG